jgi:Cytochrome c554 and c-prime
LETEQGRTLQQLPFAYIVAEKMWAPVTQTFLIPPNLKEYYSLGAWNGACMDCHVTQGQSRFVVGNRWDSQVAEFGVACEACHSEGREHIERNRNPLRRFKLHLTDKTDPGLGIWLVPVAALMLFYSIARIALDLSKQRRTKS